MKTPQSNSYNSYYSFDNRAGIKSGEYFGKWTGSTIVLDSSKFIEFSTGDINIPGMDVPVRVRVSKDSIAVYLV